MADAGGSHGPHWGSFPPKVPPLVARCVESGASAGRSVLRTCLSADPRWNAMIGSPGGQPSTLPGDLGPGFPAGHFNILTWAFSMPEF